MNNIFGMDMAEMHRLGIKMNELASSFGTAKRRLDEIVAGLVTSSYTSSDAKAIASAIKSYEPLLTAIQRKLDEYGNFGTSSSNITQATNDTITSEIAKKLNNTNFG